MREQLICVSNRHNLQLFCPSILRTPAFDPSVLQSTDVKESEETISEVEQPENFTMAQTNIEFINTASKLLPVFYGKAENLRSFLDALSIVDTIKGEHEQLAVSILKTKLKGSVRNLINSETTIIEVIKKLQSAVKGESVQQNC